MDIAAGWSSSVARWAHNPEVAWFKSGSRNKKRHARPGKANVPFFMSGGIHVLPSASPAAPPGSAGNPG